jgi:hypothetical protein
MHEQTAKGSKNRPEDTRVSLFVISIHKSSEVENPCLHLRITRLHVMFENLSKHYIFEIISMRLKPALVEAAFISDSIFSERRRNRQRKSIIDFQWIYLSINIQGKVKVIRLALGFDSRHWGKN